MFSGLASLTVVVLGILVLIGWALDLRFLTCLAPGCVAMNPMAAVVLFYLELDCGLRPDGRRVPAQEAMRLESYWRRRSRYWVPRAWRSTWARLTSRWTSFCLPGSYEGFTHPVKLRPLRRSFHFCGLALLLFDVEACRGFSPAQAFILGIGLLALLGLTSYTYRAFSLYRAGSVMPMPLGTALGLGLLVVSGHWQRARTEVSCR